MPSPVLLALLAAGALPSPAARQATAAPSRLQVVAREFTFALSRPQVRDGRAIVQLVNLGQDGHDLRLRRRGAARSTGYIPEVQPGKASSVKVTLRPGRYTLWCTLPGHRAAGMNATLKVATRR